jgi:hypothetical protein
LLYAAIPVEIRPGRSRNLAGNTPAGQRGRSGRHHCSISRLVRSEYRRQADGLFQLPQSVDRGSCRAVCFTKAYGVVVLLARAFRRRLSARTHGTGAGRDSTHVTAVRRRYQQCAAARNARSYATVRRSGRRRASPNTAPPITRLMLSGPTLLRRRQPRQFRHISLPRRRPEAPSLRPRRRLQRRMLRSAFAIWITRRFECADSQAARAMSSQALVPFSKWMPEMPRRS